MQHRTHAFSLLELSVVLVIVSLMTGFGLQAFQSGSIGGNECYANTKQQLKTIDRALQSFTASQMRLPKPAFANLGSSDPAFGYEAKGAQTDAAQANYGASDANGIPSGMTNNSGVLIGALPHAVLGLSMDYAADCWGQKFTYAVTNVLTSSHATSGYPASTVMGAITLNSNTIAAPNSLATDTSYVVISHGMDKYGATPLTGGNITPGSCSAAASGEKIDKANCDGNATFFNATLNTGGVTAEYFDDLLVYSTKMLSIINLYCWGTDSDGNGVLADNNTTVSALHYLYTPTAAVSTVQFKSFAEVSESTGTPSSACALTSDGTAYCWGTNTNGQLGVGDTTTRAVPTAVNTAAKFSKLYMFGHDTGSSQLTPCGLTSDGTAYCWGFNTAVGTVGDGTTVNKTSPTAVNTAVKFTQLVGGGLDSYVICGLATTGDAYCWGTGYVDRADGTTTATVSSPALVTGGRKFSVLNGTKPTCGITSAADALGAGKIFCWGLLNNTTHARLGLNPITISGITRANPGVVTANSHGLTSRDHFIIRYVNGMGQVNYQGNIYSGGVITTYTNTFRPGAAGLTANTFQLANSAGSNVDTSSYTSYSSSGVVIIIGKAAPTQLANPPAATFSGFAKRRSGNPAAVTSTGLVYVWGENRYNQIGNGTSDAIATQSITAVTRANPGIITTSAAHGYVVGNLVYLGGTISGMTQLKTGLYKVDSVPTSTTFSLDDMNGGSAVNTSGFSAYTSGGRFSLLPASTTCIVGSAGGTGDYQYCTLTPTQPTGSYSLASRNSLFIGYNENQILQTSAGSTKVWGSNQAASPLGDNNSVARTSPVDALTSTSTTLPFTFQTPFNKVNAAKCGISTTYETYCWGQNLYGIFGMGAAAVGNTYLYPVAMGAGIKFKQLINLSGNASTGSVTCGLSTSAASCIADAVSAAGDATLCCNGDADENGVCGGL